MSWTLSDIRSKFRSLTGRRSTNQISDANCNNYINDYYRFDFAELVGLGRFRADWTQEATATDSGEYSVSEEVVNIEEPVFCNDEPLTLYYDRDWFFRDYPSYEDWLASPALAIGTSDTAAVANSAVNYKIGGWVYAKAAAETALSGSAVPQSKYGAWLLEVDSDGTIDVNEASDNATGYDTAALAVNDLPAEQADYAVLGYVTVINTSGTFTPGTTALNASGVTATYTNGRATLRNSPLALLLDLSAGKVYIRPKCDDTYLLKSKLTLQRPTALSGDSSEPLDTKWGLCLALGAAIKCLATEEGDEERVAKLLNNNNPQNPPPGSLEYELNLIEVKYLRQMSNRRVERSF